MMTAMGQGKTQVSPYHMALITSAIANGGTLMKPYLVDSVTNYTGAVIDKNKPEKYKSLMTSEEAAKLKQYMSAVVDYGTASVLSGRAIRPPERREPQNTVQIRKRITPGLLE